MTARDTGQLHPGMRAGKPVLVPLPEMNFKRLAGGLRRLRRKELRFSSRLFAERTTKPAI